MSWWRSASLRSGELDAFPQIGHENSPQSGLSFLLCRPEEKQVFAVWVDPFAFERIAMWDVVYSEGRSGEIGHDELVASRLPFPAR